MLQIVESYFGHFFQHDRIHNSKDSIEGIVRWNTCGQFQKLPEKIFMLYGIIPDLIPCISIRNTCSQRKFKANLRSVNLKFV